MEKSGLLGYGAKKVGQLQQLENTPHYTIKQTQNLLKDLTYNLTA